MDCEAVWALVAATVEKDAFNRLPTEAMPGVALLKVYNISKALPLRSEDGAGLEGNGRHV